MDLSEAKPQLTAIRDHLPADYSQQAARKLMSSFENYRQISQALGRIVPRASTGIRTEFGDIEGLSGRHHRDAQKSGRIRIQPGPATDHGRHQ